MPQITATIHVENRFRELGVEYSIKAQEALAVATSAGAQAAAAVAAQRHGKTGKMEHITAQPITPSAEGGFEARFRSPVFWAWFQDKGTKRGITPLHFLEVGRRVARKTLMAELER